MSSRGLVPRDPRDSAPIRLRRGDVRDPELARLIGDPVPDPAMQAANRGIWIADVLLRAVLALAIVLALSVMLAVWVSPWFWIAVGVFAAYTIATIAWMVARRRGAARALAEHPTH